MRSPSTAGSLLAVALFLSTGCSSSDSETPAPTPAEPTIDDVCGEDGLYARLITRLFDCTPLYVLYLGDIDPAHLAEACDGNLGGYVTDGTVVLGSRDALDACAAFVEGAPCEEIELDEPNPCEAVFVGRVPLEGACETSTQCEGDAYCDESAGTTCGSCKPLGATGDACTTDDGCGGGRCKPGAGPEGSCQPLAGAGEACDADGDCKGSRVCGADGRCGVPTVPAQGAACDNGTGFADALTACGSLTTGRYCKPAPGGTVGTCEPFAALGEACVPLGVTSGAPWCDFTAYEACRGSVCEPPTIAQLGQPCDALAGVGCGAGLRCGDHDGAQATPNECFAPLEEGATCDPANNLCDTFLGCDAGSSRCGYEYTGSCPAP